MKSEKLTLIQDVDLPWSKGLLSAKMWSVNDSDSTDTRVVVGVPELGLHCYGSSQSEAAFRLFSSLLKYYRQLKDHEQKISARGREHLKLLRTWVESIENRLTERQEAGQVLAFRR